MVREGRERDARLSGCAVFNSLLCIHAVVNGSQDNTWQEISPRGVIPSVRLGHAAVWSNAMDGFYVWGGVTGISSEGCVLSGTCKSFTMYLRIRSDKCCNLRFGRFE